MCPTPPDERPRVLCVDDEPSVLDGLVRTLRRHFRVEVAHDPLAAIEMVSGSGPFPVVVSDMRMPGMDGAAFLAKVRELSPDTVRILLTGYADVDSAIAAINAGQIFRFLTKPCAPKDLITCLTLAVEQYRLVTSERVLLEQTLQGSIQALCEILALAHPAAFGRATRARNHVRELLDHFGISERWLVEVAAMLSQIGCVTLPPHTAEKLYHGEQLTPSELEMTARLPELTESLLAHIPRLEPVRAILRSSLQHHSELPAPADEAESTIQWGSRALKIVLDFDALECKDGNSALALRIMRGRSGSYDPRILDAFAQLRGCKDESRVIEIPASDVQLGMVLVDDVKSSRGMLLVARGQGVTPTLLERIRNFSSAVGLKEPIRVMVPSVNAYLVRSTYP
jgi:response regulator RpfG family c-di-GMP phosphodiesterase